MKETYNPCGQRNGKWKDILMVNGLSNGWTPTKDLGSFSLIGGEATFFKHANALERPGFIP